MNAVMSKRELAASHINIRAPKAKKALIDRAADALGMNRTDFVLETLCQRAHEVLADRKHFELSQEQMAAFNRILDQPINEAAVRMLTKRAPWER